MSERGRRWLRVSSTALLLGVYATLAHWSNTAAGPRGLGALVAAVPPLVVAATLALRSPYRSLTFVALAAIAAVVVWCSLRLRSHYTALMLWEQVSMWLLLSFSFARTLLPPREALCTLWADRVHGPLTPEVVRYTRAVTSGWAIFFALAALASVTLYFLAPLWAWSLYENILILPLIASAFVLEYLVRRALLPQLRHVGIFEAVRAYASHRQDGRHG